MRQEQNPMLSTFADDTVILSRSNFIYDATDMLQLYSKTFENWACRWSLSINPAKCTVVTHYLRKESCPGLFLHGELLKQVRDYKYLGVSLDNRLTFAKHTTIARRSLEEKARMLFWLPKANNHLSSANKVRKCKSILAPTWR
ncbi:hypothetical protein KR038_009967, partial [Drosophila bunnanda]